MTTGDPDIRTLASSVIYEDTWMALRGRVLTPAAA
jgi:hypothetical protein